MNPAFILIVLIAVVALWLLASGIYRLIGKFVWRIVSDAINEMKDEENEEEEQ